MYYVLAAVYAIGLIIGHYVAVDQWGWGEGAKAEYAFKALVRVWLWPIWLATRPFVFAYKGIRAWYRWFINAESGVVGLYAEAWRIQCQNWEASRERARRSQDECEGW